MNIYSPTERKLLLTLAMQSIVYGLKLHKVMSLNLTDYVPKLQAKRACFVTLDIKKQLRGCIGSLEAYQPLVLDVVHNAYAAAFSDPRFPPLTAAELDLIRIHISVLNVPTAMQFTSEADLVQQLQPGVDGLILAEGANRGTFLPSVWESLPEPKQFLDHLKMKAGLAPNYWSDTVTVARYTVELIE